MVKWSRYRPGVAQRVGRGIALLFHDRGTRRGWVVSSTPRPHFTPGKDQVPTAQEAGWDPGPVWTGGKSRLHRDSIRDLPARSQSLYRLSYPAHLLNSTIYVFNCTRVFSCKTEDIIAKICILFHILYPSKQPHRPSRRKLVFRESGGFSVSNLGCEINWGFF